MEGILGEKAGIFAWCRPCVSHRSGMWRGGFARQLIVGVNKMDCDTAGPRA